MGYVDFGEIEDLMYDKNETILLFASMSIKCIIEIEVAYQGPSKCSNRLPESRGRNAERKGV